MNHLLIKSGAEQVADHLRKQIHEYAWIGSMPGGIRLSRELRVGRMTIEEAFKILENEGLLRPQGKGRGREIVLPEEHLHPDFRIRILLYSDCERRFGLYLDLRNRLCEVGLKASFADQTWESMNRSVKRLRRYVRKAPADAWLVVAGSREELECVSSQGLPVFALFGEFRGLPVAGTGPGKRSALDDAMDRLVNLGHRRIVILERNWCADHELEGHWLYSLFSDRGIPVSTYNIPSWDDSPDGLKRCMETLFRHTPPTALFTDSPITHFGAMSLLAEMGYRVPQDVSMICMDPSVEFRFMHPSVAHISYQEDDWIRRIVGWGKHVANRRRDVGQPLSKCRYVEGGSVGPVPSRVVIHAGIR